MPGGRWQTCTFLILIGAPEPATVDVLFTLTLATATTQSVGFQFLAMKTLKLPYAALTVVAVGGTVIPTCRVTTGEPMAGALRAVAAIGTMVRPDGIAGYYTETTGISWA